LLDDSHLTVVPSSVESSDVFSIESHSPFLRQVELLQHGDATRLSASTSSNEGNDFPVLVIDLKADVVKSDYIQLLRVREGDVFKGKMSGDSRIILNLIAGGVHDFRNSSPNPYELFVHSLDSQDITNDKGHHPELENERLRVENVLGKITDRDFILFEEAVRHVADDRQSSVLANLLNETETGSPDLFLNTGFVDTDVSRFKLIDLSHFSGESLHRLDVSETLEGV